jgi:predicted acyl esterase
VGKRYLTCESAVWDEAIKHDTYDVFWRERNFSTHLKEIKPAVMTVGGWFDAEILLGALEVYTSVRKNSPRSSILFVMGAWSHGGWVRDEGSKVGDVSFNMKSYLT